MIRAGVCGWCRAQDEDLDELVDVCRGTDEAWVLFNNHSMFEDAHRFRERARDDGLEVV